MKLYLNKSHSISGETDELLFTKCVHVRHKGEGTQTKPYFFPDNPIDNEMPDVLRRTHSTPDFTFYLTL